MENKDRGGRVAVRRQVIDAVRDALGTFGEVGRLEGDEPIVSETDAQSG